MATKTAKRLETAKARLDRAGANLDRATTDLQRAITLNYHGTVIEAYEARVESAKEVVGAAHRALQIARAN